MQPMTVTEIVSAVKGVWWNPSDQVPVVSAVSTDSRRIVPGSLFLPWVGEKFDGHLFIDAALDAGAAGCLCAKLPQNIREDKFYIKVADTRLALRDLASAYRDRFEIPFVQITGSVGKTTTKEMIAAVLGAILVMHLQVCLPFLLAFAAGAMIYVVVEELIPESQTNENKDWMALFTLVGFSLMMCLDVALG